MIFIRSRDTKIITTHWGWMSNWNAILGKRQGIILQRKAHLKNSENIMLLSKQHINRDYLKNSLEYNYIIIIISPPLSVLICHLGNDIIIICFNKTYFVFPPFWFPLLSCLYTIYPYNKKTIHWRNIGKKKILFLFRFMLFNPFGPQNIKIFLIWPISGKVCQPPDILYWVHYKCRTHNIIELQIGLVIALYTKLMHFNGIALTKMLPEE